MSDVSILEFLKKSKFNLKKANYYKEMYLGTALPGGKAFQAAVRL